MFTTKNLKKCLSKFSCGYTIPQCALYRLTFPWCIKLCVKGQALSYDCCDRRGVQRLGFRVLGMSHSPFSCHRSPPEARPLLTDRCK